MHLHFGFPVEAGIVVAILVAGILYVAVLIDEKYQFHRAIFWPIRRTLLYWLGSLVIDLWKVYVDIDSNGDARVIHDFSGKVNFGFNRWITLGFRADSDQPTCPDFPIRITNKLNDEEVKADFIIDAPRYKRLRVNFQHELRRGDKFHYEVVFGLSRTFFFGKKDYYAFQAYHHEKRIMIDVRFPDDVVVSGVCGEITTEHGDTWKKHKQPERISVKHIVCGRLKEQYMGMFTRLSG